jgi:proton-translocating NADH-quinone oxidoreductase chain N
MSGNAWVATPLVFLFGGAFTVYLVARLVTRRNEVLAVITTVFFGSALLSVSPLYLLTSSQQNGLSGLPVWGNFMRGGAFLRVDQAGLVVVTIALAMGMIVSVYSGTYLQLDRRYKTYYPLLLLMLMGLVGMVFSSDLFNLYMFCELMSISAYILVAFRRTAVTPVEAGFKYLIMGSVGTITMLLGIGFVYREMGTLALPLPAGEPGIWTRAAMACFLIGLGIKSAIVPLHTWLPDAQEQAPSSISALISAGVDPAALYVLIKVALGLGLTAPTLGALLIGASILNMVLGNTMALVQINAKRLLAYSTIAQMGYIMFSIGIGLHYDIPQAIQAGFFLLLVHAFLKGLAFLSKGVSNYYCQAMTLDDLTGIASRVPAIGVTFSLSLAGLASLPPLVGFTAKWFVLSNALRAGGALAITGTVVFLVSSLIALGYYLPFMNQLFRRSTGVEQLTVSAWMLAPMVVISLIIIAFSLHPAPWMDWVTGTGWSLFLLVR